MGSFIHKSKRSGFVVIVVELDARLAGRYGLLLLALQAKFYDGDPSNPREGSARYSIMVSSIDR